MSSVLDALRKLDEQKNARKQRPVDVAAGLVRTPSGVRALSVRGWQIAGALVLVAGLSVYCTVLLLGKKAPPPALSPQARTGAASVSPGEALVPVGGGKGAVAPAAKASPVVKPRAREASGSEPAWSTPSPAVANSPAGGVEAPQAAESPRPPLPQRHPAPLKVTGIGWQKDASARFAVINGTSVPEGGSIDGARVEEILPDKVRMKVEGRTVEIGLGR